MGSDPGDQAGHPLALGVDQVEVAQGRGGLRLGAQDIGAGQRQAVEQLGRPLGGDEQPAEAQFEGFEGAQAGGGVAQDRG